MDWKAKCLHMSCIALLDLRKAEELHYFMPSIVVMWSQPSLVKEINLHGRPGTCVPRLLMALLDSASTPMVMIYDKSNTATGVNNARLLICLLGSRDHTKPFHQLDQLYFSMSSVLPTKQAAYGANEHCTRQNT